MNYPPPSFDHLFRLSDGTGVFEHADGPVPSQRDGYCLDDVARVFVVALREPRWPPALRRLLSTCFAFIVRAQVPDGRFHNRLSAAPESRWLDEVGSDDASGRALCALGHAVHSVDWRFAEPALVAFKAGAGFDSPSPRANAWAAIGASEVLSSLPGNRAATSLLERAVPRLGVLSPDPRWPWPERRLAYDNPRLAEARIAAGAALDDKRLTEEGLSLLGWLIAVETNVNHFSFTPVGGWEPGEPRPGYDQQPIEAGSMADACARAYEVTGDRRWARSCLQAASWFLGANDAAIPLLDPESGGCHDGLERGGCNANEGAESATALIGALQHARELQRPAPTGIVDVPRSLIYGPSHATRNTW